MTDLQQKYLDTHKDELVSKSNHELLYLYALASRKHVEMAFDQHEDAPFQLKIVNIIYSEVIKRMDKGAPEHV